MDNGRFGRGDVFRVPEPRTYDGVELGQVGRERCGVFHPSVDSGLGGCGRRRVSRVEDRVERRMRNLGDVPSDGVGLEDGTLLSLENRDTTEGVQGTNGFEVTPPGRIDLMLGAVGIRSASDDQGFEALAPEVELLRRDKKRGVRRERVRTGGQRVRVGTVIT